jgi:hypothetical protein
MGTAGDSCIAGFRTALCPSRVELRHGGDVRCTTALPPKAEIHRRPCYVAKVPRPAVSRCSKCRVRKLELFDHLLGGCEHARRDGEAQRLRGLHVDDQFELYISAMYEFLHSQLRS